MVMYGVVDWVWPRHMILLAGTRLTGLRMILSMTARSRALVVATVGVVILAA